MATPRQPHGPRNAVGVTVYLDSLARANSLASVCCLSSKSPAMDALRKVRDGADFKRTVREIKNKGEPPPDTFARTRPARHGRARPNLVHPPAAVITHTLCLCLCPCPCLSSAWAVQSVRAWADRCRLRLRCPPSTVYNYTEMEQLVREATCNAPGEPSPMLMKEIAKGTFTVDFSNIMSIVWKRVKDKTTEHHPYKCLLLLEYLLREGNADLVAEQVNNNLHLVQALTSFRLLNASKIEVGGRVR